MALSTDDEGVSRIDITHEYVRAVETFGLRYPDLKQMVRTGMEHSFLPGDSLWRDRDTFRMPVSALLDRMARSARSPRPDARFSAEERKGGTAVGTRASFPPFESSH